VSAGSESQNQNQNQSQSQNQVGATTRLCLVDETVCQALPVYDAAGHTPAPGEAPDPGAALLA